MHLRFVCAFVAKRVQAGDAIGDALGCEHEAAYPTRKAGDDLKMAGAQWVDGDHEALNYRGNELKRSKVWFQRGDPLVDGFRRYLYTGWQKAILPATADVRKCEELESIWDAFDDFCAREGDDAVMLEV
jgi:hypothetical protein